MDKSAAIKWVDENLPKLRKMYGIAHWNIKTTYGPIEGTEAAGQCSYQPQYENAHIEINPEQIDDEEELKKIVCHELCHIVHSPFGFFADPIFQLISENEFRAMKRLYDHAQELVVKNIERMHEGHMEAFRDGTSYFYAGEADIPNFPMEG